MCSSRDRPEPLSSTRPFIGRALRFRNAWIACADFAVVAGGLHWAAPIVRNRLRAITLLLNLLMSRTTSDSTGLRCVPTSRAFDGVGPSRVVPWNVPPACFHSARKPPAKNVE